MGSGIKKRESKLFMKKFLYELDIEKRHKDIRNNIECELDNMQYLDPVLKNFKFVIFEGGDFSGKSTQAERLAQHYNHCMVVHFPRTTNLNPSSYKDEKSSSLHPLSRSTKDVYEYTNKWLYNDDFWKEYFYELEKRDNKKYKIIEDYKDLYFTGTGFDKNDKILRDCLESNIFYNFVDKIYFFVELKNFITGVKDYFEYNYDYKFYIDGKEVTEPDKIREVINIYRYKDKERVIILDRFILSGKIYNSYIPKMWIINKFVKHFNTYRENPITVDEMVKLIQTRAKLLKLTPESIEFDKYVRKLFEESYHQFNYMCDLLDTITQKQSECDNKLVEYLNNLTGFNIKYKNDLPSHGLKDTFHSNVNIDDKGMSYEEQFRTFESYDYFNRNYEAFKNNTLNTNFINVNCYRSEKILETIKKDAIDNCRKVDAYDKNTLMQKVVNQYFDECKKMSNDLSSPVQNVNIFKTDVNFRENLYLNTLNVDSDKFYLDDDDPTFDNKETMIHNISEFIKLMINDYNPKDDFRLINYNKTRDSIKYMNY